MIELLVVVAIIGILASILLPALSKAKAQAYRAICLSNLKQLSMVIQLYGDDHSDLLPPNPHDVASGPGVSFEGEHYWTRSYMAGTHGTDPIYLTTPENNLLAAYHARVTKLYKCPADKVELEIDGTISGVPRLRTYALNHAVGTECETFPPNHSGPPIYATPGTRLHGQGANHRRGQTWMTYGKTSSFRNPSDKFVFIDVGQRRDFRGTAFVVMMAEMQWWSWPGLHHNYGAGLSFADGHAEVHRWLEPTTNPKDKAQVMHASPPFSKSRDWTWLTQRTSERIR